MAANYPSSLPVKDPAGSLLSSNPHSALHNNMYDEIVAIATELGINASGAAADVAARIALLESGAWVDSTTTTIWQGTATPNISKTINYSKVRKSLAGETSAGWEWAFSYTLTGSGTASNAIKVYAPFGWGSTSWTWGHGTIYDSSANLMYICNLSGTGSPNGFQFSTDDYGFYWGASGGYNVAAASGDILTGYCIVPASTAT